MLTYIESFYNTTRMHSSINRMSPRELQRQFDEKLRANKPHEKHLSESGAASHSPFRTQPSHAATHCVR